MGRKASVVAVVVVAVAVAREIMDAKAAPVVMFVGAGKVLVIPDVVVAVCSRTEVVACGGRARG